MSLTTPQKLWLLCHVKYWYRARRHWESLEGFQVAVLAVSAVCWGNLWCPKQDWGISSGWALREQSSFTGRHGCHGDRPTMEPWQRLWKIMESKWIRTLGTMHTSGMKLRVDSLWSLPQLHYPWTSVDLRAPMTTPLVTLTSSYQWLLIKRHHPVYNA